ncbi:uncharacterized protein LOC115875975 isoform X2 [Sitophilus oryzae]|uniref:Uncharacterized protein LOC115875975 isoform X2 n=1 Tax=Sitophilus oryzae TaxID=7048 RepID=A0A6J2X8E3_SITOR|nr:uncharacterized protein LOC115875975 isoform X2 [Sitophilus oryzae]
MEILCKQMENQATDNISPLAHILNLNSNIILQQELDKLFLSTYTCLKNLQLHESYIQTVNNILNDIKLTNYILLKGYKIYIYDKNFCLTVLFGSLIYSDILKKHNQNAVTEEIIFTIEYILNNFSTDIPVSILKILDNILKKYRYIIDSKLALSLFMFIQKLNSSPLESFKYHNQNISKLVVQLLHTDQVDRILDVHYFPLKGIETSEFVNYFKTKVHDNIFAKKVIFKVLDMFTNNIENREGGFLYESLLSRDLNSWSTTIWPHFFTHIQYTDFESEFFQSILKYFIPSTVNIYKMSLHDVTMNLAIPLYIKGYILLTLRRKLFIDEFTNEAIFTLSSCIMTAETRSLALEIISLCNKRKKCPSKIELQLVKYFLCSQGESLNNEVIKSLHKFLSHLAVICMDLQNITDQNDGNKETLSMYQTFLNDIQRLGHQLIEKDIIGFGAQILNIISKLRRREFNLYYKIDELSSNCVNFKTCVISGDNKNVCNLIENCLIENDFSNLELTKLANCMKCDKLDNAYLMEYIEHHTYNISILTSESIIHLARIVVSNNKHEANIILYSKLCTNLNKIFSEKFKSNILNLRYIFEALLLFDVLLELINFKFKYEASAIEMVEQCFDVVDIILEHVGQGNISSDDMLCNNDQYSFKHKIKKIVEALLNNILQYIMGTLDFLDTSKAVKFLSKIIEKSNMRRPTTISAQILIKALDKHQGDHTFNEFKFLFLNDIMLKLFYASSVQQLTIRRNPESRLIIHALCVSDKNLSKPFLKWTFNELIRILSDSTSSSSTVASALHCIETLISDSTLHNETLKFVPDVYKICVNLFDQKHWTVR